MYTFKSRVRYSETGQDGHLSLESIMNYLQDCSTFQSEDLGIGLASLRVKRRAWLVSGWQILIDSYPALGEEITVGTQAVDFSKGLGQRNFVIRDAEGQYLVKANSLWLYLDTESGRPVRPDPEEVERYGTSEPIPMDYAPRKIILPDELEKLEGIPVREHHLDTNHHVNNAQYVSLARELLPGDVTVAEVRVDYRMQARLGDVLIPKIGKDGNWIYVAFCNEKEHIYSAIGMRTREGKLCWN